MTTMTFLLTDRFQIPAIHSSYSVLQVIPGTAGRRRWRTADSSLRLLKAGADGAAAHVNDAGWLGMTHAHGLPRRTSGSRFCRWRAKRRRVTKAPLGESPERSLVFRTTRALGA